MIIFIFNSSEQLPASLCEYHVKFQDYINNLFKIGHIVVQKNWIYYPVCYKPIITHSEETWLFISELCTQAWVLSGVPKIKCIAYKNFLNLVKHKNIVNFFPEHNKNAVQILFLSMCSSWVPSQFQLWGLSVKTTTKLEEYLWSVYNEFMSPVISIPWLWVWLGVPDKVLSTS